MSVGGVVDSKGRKMEKGGTIGAVLQPQGRVLVLLKRPSAGDGAFSSADNRAGKRHTPLFTNMLLRERSLHPACLSSSIAPNGQD